MVMNLTIHINYCSPNYMVVLYISQYQSWLSHYEQSRA